MFAFLLISGMVAGSFGGWQFGRIKNQLPESYHTTFDVAAVLMLLQDVLIAFFYLRGSAIVVFLTIIFFCPAVGFLAFDRMWLFRHE